MTVPIALVVVGVLMLILAARYVAAMALTGKECFRLGHPLGLRGVQLRTDEAAWDAGHRAARPLLGVAAAVAALNALGTIGLVGGMGTLPQVIIVVIQFALILAIAEIARRVAIREARVVRR
ncbi:hypothetical protein H8R18_08290 [Nanchangia anserum]|uniref:SdpI family protein n=1 Tax=Nanchangia anserum TaxID=2692125 RepID=A0A8I0GCK1_9ACTO|nr:hypothetical protein [Nanchangia anserum]MBD3689516.1 hypothetical protein [Nanchangia anserum]QOX81707.1 hypothetical protein H8R18_08290 [Nanchangia anserum]